MPFIRCIVLQLVVVSVHGHTWPSVQMPVTEVMPNLEISLQPPVMPLPQVSTEIGDLEAAREKIENSNMNKLTSAFNIALKASRTRIGEVVGRTMTSFEDTVLFRRPPASFLEQQPQMNQINRGETMSVKVAVAASRP